jgi:hypothetical protein
VSRTYRRTAYQLRVLTFADQGGCEQTIRVTDEHRDAPDVNGHNLDVEVDDAARTLRGKYKLTSKVDPDVVEERPPDVPVNQLDTEVRFVDHIGDSLNNGDLVLMRGRLGPSAGAAAAMTESAVATGAEYTYFWQGWGGRLHIWKPGFGQLL